MKRKDESHERIVRAAIALFSRRSYHGTSVREIARIADVNELTVFRHFVSKEAIFHAALEESFASIKSRLNALESTANTEPPALMLRQIVSFFVDISEFSPDVVRLTAVAILEGNGKARELCSRNLSPVFLRISDYLESQCRAGKIKTASPSIATAAIAFSILAQPEISKINKFAASNNRIREVIKENTQFWIDALGA